MKILFIVFLITSNFVQAQTTIYLVRHAEKITTKDVNDPTLTQIGQFRATNIAKQLSTVGITHIFSTDTIRTMDTAKPLANHLKLKIEIYDPRQLEKFANHLKKMQGTILVVGHSNTTPELTSLLSGKNIQPIADNEYDNLYQVIITESQTLLNVFKTIPSYGLNTAHKNNEPSKLSIGVNMSKGKDEG